MKKKIIHYGVYLLLAAIHLFFILKLIWRKQNDIELAFILMVIVVSMVLAYKRFFSHHTESTTGNYLEVLAVVIGAVATYYLAQMPHMNSILASCIVGLTVSFAPNIFPKVKNITDFPSAIYCGSFVGMSSEMVLDNIWLLINASLVSGFLFSYAKTAMHGIGGKLGSIAFVGVLIVITLYTLFA